MIVPARPVKLIAHHSVSLLVLVVIAVVMLGANPMAGETIAPFDILTRMPGWKNTGIVSPVKHHKHVDVLDYKLPSWRFAREKLRQGELPIWNPHVLGGEPLMLLVTRSIITPAFAVYALFDDEGVGLYASALVNLLVISLGSYLLFFSLTRHRLAALLGAVAFSYSGFNLSWFLWHHVNTSIWIPWLLLFAVRLLQSGDVRHLPWLAMASTLMILGGFPTVAVYGYIALLLLLLCWALFSRNSYRSVSLRVAWVAGGVVLSLISSLLFLYCLNESLGRLDLDYRLGGTAFRSAEDLLLFVMPFGDGPLTLGRTGYVGLLPLILFLPALWLTWRSRIDWRYAWGLSLVVLISPIAFAWIPMEYVRQIPLIGTSMISRLILIIGLGFSLLAALVLAAGHDRIGSSRPLWANLVLIILLSFQVVDQRQVFQKLVGYVKAQTIYPLTPAIDYVRRNIEPLQTVLSDRGFLYPGVLSAYGLSEWFAHGFHTEQEKRLLSGIVDNPFLTPTASGFLCGQVRFEDSQSLAHLAVRYVLCSSVSEHRGVGLTRMFNTFADTNSNGGLDLLRHEVTQRVEIYDDITFDLLEIPLQAGGGADGPAVRLKLYNETTLVAESELCAMQRISDGGYLRCRFARQVVLGSGDYQVELAVGQKAEDVSLVVAVYDAVSPLFQLIVDGDTSEGMLGLRGYVVNLPTAYQGVLRGEDESYAVLRPEPGVVLVENKRVKGSAYFVPMLNGSPPARYDQLRLNAYRETSMQFEYMGEQPGWVVIPVRSYPGWSFKVNGVEVQGDLFKGVLPAVHVSGGDRIDFSYRPVQYLFPAVVSILGCLLCLGLMFGAKRINQWFSDQER